MPKKRVQEIRKTDKVINSYQGIDKLKSLRRKIMFALFTYQGTIIYYLITHP